MNKWMSSLFMPIMEKYLQDGRVQALKYQNS